MDIDEGSSQPNIVQEKEEEKSCFEEKQSEV